jgi:hypothetical protein
MNRKITGAIVGLVLAGAVCLLIYGLTDNWFEIGYNKNYQPDQPLPFSHQIHVQQNKIDCQYCHTGVRENHHALVPSLNICMNCHLTVKTDSPHIKKLSEAYFANKPIEWEKVHLLPDFVKFNHSAHIQAGKQCVDCHGQVQEMDVVKQVESLSMGFCVNCHRKPENQAPTHCSACHY